VTVWKLSAGTACALGKKQIKTDVLPTTAYIMLGEKCRNNCRFCAQARDSSARANMLSRVTWLEVIGQEAAQAIGEAFQAGRLRRACLQIVRQDQIWEEGLDALAALTQTSAVPVCISADIESVAQAKELIERGTDRISLALDAATPLLYREIKGGDWNKRWQLLTDCAAKLPGRVSTHLIVGLGETEEEMVTTIADCYNHSISVGLFAFTPLRGTAWGDKVPPPIDSYRRIQIAHFLLSQGYTHKAFSFGGGRLVGINLPPEKLAVVLATGKAFETSGCEGCNRPYYNERPGGIMYNYPRSLTLTEIDQALEESGLTDGGNVDNDRAVISVAR